MAYFALGGKCFTSGFIIACSAWVNMIVAWSDRFRYDFWLKRSDYFDGWLTDHDRPARYSGGSGQWGSYYFLTGFYRLTRHYGGKWWSFVIRGDSTGFGILRDYWRNKFLNNFWPNSTFDSFRSVLWRNGRTDRNHEYRRRKLPRKFYSGRSQKHITFLG